MNTTTNSDMPQNTTNASSLFARGAIIAGKKADRWRASASNISKPLGWRKPRHIEAMSDLFHKDVSFDFIDKVFAVMALCPQHTFQILTKRPERMAEYFLTRTAIDDSGRYDTAPQWYQVITHWLDEGYGGGRFFDTERAWDKAHDLSQLDFSKPIPNVWLGTSIENRNSLERIMDLAQCPATVRFISFEPLIEDLGQIRGYLEQLAGSKAWAIVGGESGPNARPCDIAWIRSIVGQCKSANVPVFVKQLGTQPFGGAFNEWPDGKCFHGVMMLKDRKGGDISEWPADLRVRELPESAVRT